MATIIGLCGSLRRDSFNLMLLRAAIASPLSDHQGSQPEHVDRGTNPTTLGVQVGPFGRLDEIGHPLANLSAGDDVASGRHRRLTLARIARCSLLGRIGGRVLRFFVRVAHDT